MKKLGFGLMRLPLTDAKNIESIDQGLVNAMVDYYMERGFNYFDTAYLYHQGLSEGALKKAVTDRYPRESFFLADKMPVYLVKSYDDYQKFFDEQCARCGVEYFDYYLLHNLGAKNYADTLKHGGFEHIKQLKAQGKAKKIGFSFHDKAELLDKILTDHPEMEFVQLQINYADWESESIQSRLCYEVAIKHNKPIIVMEPVKGGGLALVPNEVEVMFKAAQPDMSAASWALRFVASLDNVFLVLSGMSDMAQVVDNIATFDGFRPLSAGERDIVDKAAEIITRGIEIPCTACGYCLEVCPKKLPIPRYFSLYNDQNQFGIKPMHISYYTNLRQDYPRAFDCLSCGECEKNCPQRLKIAEHMKKVSKVFEPKLWE